MRKFLLFAVILPIFVLGGFFIYSKSAQAENILISNDTTWTADSVITINDGDYVTVKFATSLTIEPGTIIKLGQDSFIRVFGNLNAIGTTDMPIVFTSLKDDSVGGDTNGDGDASKPTIGDWNTIIAYGNGWPNHGVVNISYAKLTYSSVLTSALGNGTINVSHSDIVNNKKIIGNTYAYGYSIGYSNIYNTLPCEDNETATCPLSFTAYNYTSLVNNYWGDPGGLDAVEYLFNGWGRLVYVPYSSTEIPNFTEKLEPVILIPGIMGSWNLGLGWTLDPILHTYDNLWSALKLAGYEDGKTLFAFPYNWRLSNVYNAQILKDKIDEVKVICDCDQVDVVAHSMGGLVARVYIEMGNYDNDIDQLIFLATPHRGGSKAYLTWEGGEFGAKREDFLFSRIFKVESEFNGFPSVYQYVRELPMKSVEELLPIYNYLRDEDTMTLRTYPNNYPQNLFLELLNNPLILSKLNGVNMANIIGQEGEDSTIDNYRVLENIGSDGEWEYGYPEHYKMPFTDHGLEYSQGDGTVPTRSNSDFYGLDNIVINSDHNNLVTDAQKQVIKILTGTEPTQEIKNLFNRIMLIRIFSPADFHITAPDGKILGKDFTSGEIINEIDNGFYSGYEGVPEFAVILDPQEGDYTVALQGTGDGPYKLSISYIDDEQDTDQEFSYNITNGEQQVLDFNYSGEGVLNDPTLEINNIDDLIRFIDDRYIQGLIVTYGDRTSLINLITDLQKTMAKDKSAVKINKQIGLIEQHLENIMSKGRIDINNYDIIKKAIEYFKNNL